MSRQRVTVRVPTPAEIESLRGLVVDQRSRRINPPSRPINNLLDHEEYPTPEVYIARTPRGGIPALSVIDVVTGSGSGSGTGPTDRHYVPGRAECIVWRRLETQGGYDEIIEQTNLKKIVYNLSSCDIDGDIFVTIKRDKWDTWTVDDVDVCGLVPGEGSGTGTEGVCDCTERVIDVMCFGNVIVVTKLFDLWDCQGRRIRTVDVPCPSTGPEDQPTPFCPLRVRIDGVVNADCTNCALNGDVDLPVSGNGWHSYNALPGVTCTGGAIEMAVSYFSGTWTLRIVGFADFTNTSAGSSWDGRNTIGFTLSPSSVTSFCNFSAASVSAHCAPASSGTCDLCATDPGDALHLYCEGATAGADCPAGCSSANGFFTLKRSSDPCVWNSRPDGTLFTVCGIASTSWRVTRVEGNWIAQLWAEPVSQSIAAYTAPVEDCMSFPVILNKYLTSAPTYCNMPDTIQLTL